MEGLKEVGVTSTIHTNRNIKTNKRNVYFATLGSVRYSISKNH